jgi:hypothetical protein
MICKEESFLANAFRTEGCAVVRRPGGCSEFAVMRIGGLPLVSKNMPPPRVNNAQENSISAKMELALAITLHVSFLKTSQE